MKKLFNDKNLYNQKDSYLVTMVKVVMIVSLFFVVTLTVPSLIILIIKGLFNYKDTNTNLVYVTLIITQVILMIIYNIIYHKDKKNYPVVKESNKMNYVYGVILIVGVAFLSLYLMELLNFYTDEEPNTTLLIGISAVIGAPLMEEVLFRGLILNRLLSKMSIWVAILLSSLLFAVSHLEFTQAIYCFFMGVAIAYVYVKTRSLIPCMIGHGLINLKSCFALNNTPLFYILFIITMILMIYSIYKLLTSDNPKLDMCINKTVKE